MSRYTFSSLFIKLLSNSPKQYILEPSSSFNIFMNRHLFLRNVKLSKFFSDPSSNDNFNPNFHIPFSSTFTPDVDSQLCNLLDNAFDAIPPEPKYTSNTFIDNCHKLKSQTHFLKYTKADKSNTIVIVHMKDYEFLVNKHLADEKTYEKVYNFNIIHLIAKLKKHVDSFVLKQEDVKFITYTKNCRMSYFRVLPKIHKCNDILNYIQENPNSHFVNIPFPLSLTSRPIVGNSNSITTKLSILINHLISELEVNVFSSLKDTFHLISSLPNNVTSDSILYTGDIESMYTNIKNSLGLEALDYWMTSFPINNYEKNFILSSISFILENNYFSFKNQTFRQVRGVAMGTNFAPKYANLVFGYIENKMMNHPTLNDITLRHIKFHYWRYLDDILIIWNKSLQDISLIFNFLNSFDSDINLIFTTGQKIETFLDTKIIIENNKIKRDIFYKSTNNHNYLFFNSPVKFSYKKNIPHCLFHRINQIVSETTWKTFRFNEMFTILFKLGYPISLLNESLDKVLSKTTTITQQKQNKKIVTYTSEKGDKTFSEIVRPLLKLDNDFMSNFDIFKIEKQQQNIITFLNKNEYPCEVISVSSCNHIKCKICADIIQYRSSIILKNKKILLNRSSNCNSSFVIYYLKCKCCNDDYIGKSESSLKVRMNKHRSDLKNCSDNSLKITQHLYACGSGFSCTIIYQEMSKSPLKLSIAEKYFINLIKPTHNVIYNS